MQNDFSVIDPGPPARRTHTWSYRLGLLVMAGYLPAVPLLLPSLAQAEVCTTQSQLKPADRDSIVQTARSLASLVQANDAVDLRARTIPEYAKDSGAMTSLVGSTAPKVVGAPLSVDQVYLLDASNLKTLGDGTNQDAQFFCTLNKSIAETEFLIPALPPGVYAFAIVTAQSANAPWRMSFLMRRDQNGSGWALAGFYPSPLTAGGHDGIWYWIRAREFVKQKQLWNGYLYYQEAQTLLQPVAFLSSSHLEKLHKESAAGSPPALSEGVSAEIPLVVKGQAGAEYRFTSLTTDDSLGADRIDVLVHLQADPAVETEPAVGAAKPSTSKASPPPASPRERNLNAMTALLAAFPELRTNFHGVWVFADAPGKNPIVTEQPMANIP